MNANDLWELLHDIAPFIQASRPELYEQLQSVLDNGAASLIDRIDGRTETIEWIPITDELPDEDLTVLVECRNNNEIEVWPGYLDSGDWRCASGGRLVGVVAWAEMPRGSKGGV